MDYVTRPPRTSDFINRWYPVLALLVLCLALFNLTFRLGSEFVTEWDESLYGISAWEAVNKGSWLGTTFMGQLDYYNTKPPLLVWLIAASFKVFGPSLISLRLVSVVSAWLTVAVLQEWTRRCFGRPVALVASLTLSTMFGFLYVHSGRSAATDAPFTLLMVLTVVVVWAQTDRPRLRIWLGPIFAAAFMLRGTAVLLPLAFAVIAIVFSRRHRKTAIPTTIALLLFLLPVGLWAMARYRLDGWQFLGPLVMYDFVARTIRPIEEHSGRTFYYFKVLQQHHYDWLFAAVVAWLLSPGRWLMLRQAVQTWRDPRHAPVLLAIWAGLAFLIPTVMQTKVPWYLNTFYPAFAVGIGLICIHGLSAASRVVAGGWRVVAMVVAVVIALGVAEGKLLWYSFARRDLRFSGQSLVLAERQRLQGRRLFLEPHARAPHFVAEAIVGAVVVHVANRADFPSVTHEGDFVLSTRACDWPGFRLLQSTERRFLYERVDSLAIIGGAGR